MTWTAPEHWLRIETIDAHTEGEPLRIILAGFPELAGGTVLARRRVARSDHDELRRALMWEPRGHPDMYGCLVMPPVRPGSDFSVLFMHNEGYSTMCGHGIIGVAKLAVEAGWIDGAGEERPVTIDTPAGLVRATAILDGERVREVRFVNVPSFAPSLGQAVEVEGLGTVSYDLAFGGAFYAYVDADALGLSLTPAAAADLIDAGRRITHAVSTSAGGDISHPDDPDLGFLYGTVFTGAAADAAHHSRHVCIFADGELDRSPTGTAVSGRLAILHARGRRAGRYPEIRESSSRASSAAGSAGESSAWRPSADMRPSCQRWGGGPGSRVGTSSSSTRKTRGGTAFSYADEPVPPMSGIHTPDPSSTGGAMPHIETVAPDEARGLVAREYEKAIRRAGRVFNVIGIQSLNPPVMRASIQLYEALILAPGPLGRDVREMLATVTSRELDCFY